MDLWTFGGADASVASTWLGLRHARLKVVVLQSTVVLSFGCFVFKFWVLCASVFIFECFVFETTQSIRMVSAGFSFVVLKLA